VKSINGCPFVGGRMIQTVIKMRAKPQNRKELVQTVQALSAYTKKEHGCLRYDVYHDSGDENTIIFLGEWKSREDQYGHMNSGKFGVFVGQAGCWRNALKYH
jgi:quinol monooxygenase YgiN